MLRDGSEPPALVRDLLLSMLQSPQCCTRWTLYTATSYSWGQTFMYLSTLGVQWREKMKHISIQMRKPCLGPEITAGLAARCLSVSLGGLLPEPGRHLGSCGHMGNDGWTPSADNGFHLWVLTSGFFNSSTRNTRDTLSAKDLLSSAGEGSLQKFGPASTSQTPTGDWETLLSLPVKIQCWNDFLVGYQWQKAPLQFEEGAC